ADALLTKACAEQPKQVELWTTRARFAAWTGQSEQVEKILAAARTAVGDRAELRAVELETWSGAEKDEDVQRFLREREGGLDRLSAADRLKVLLPLAASYYHFGKITDGDRIAGRAVNELNDALGGGSFPDWVQWLDLTLQGQDDAVFGEVVEGLK